MKQRQPAKGFTLIEILIVIAIIGILGVMGVTSYLASQRQARDGRRVADLKQIQGVLENYYTEMKTYPANACPTALASYFPQGFPKDPTTKINYAFPDTQCNPDDYCLCIQLENTTTGGNASNATCTFSDTGSYFCIKNLQ